MFPLACWATIDRRQGLGEYHVTDANYHRLLYQSKVLSATTRK